jgi:hypothetical protein
MKKIILILCIASCNTGMKPVKEFYSEQAKFKIQYPANWRFDSTRYAIVQDISGITDSFQESVVLGSEPMPLGISIENFAKSFSTSMKLLDSNYLEVKTESLKIDTTKAVKITFQTIQNQQAYKSMAILYIHDSTAFTIQANALQSSFKEAEADFESIFKSIRITK